MNTTEISNKLIATAFGGSYHEDALRAAHANPALTEEERWVVLRYMSGNQRSTDHQELHSIAHKIVGDTMQVADILAGFAKIQDYLIKLDNATKLQAGAIPSTSKLGGARPGAGRPKLDATDKKVSVTVRLTPAQKIKLVELGGGRWVIERLDEYS